MVVTTVAHHVVHCVAVRYIQDDQILSVVSQLSDSEDSQPIVSLACSFTCSFIPNN